MLFKGLSVLPKIDISDPTLRFLLLEPEQQSWFEEQEFELDGKNFFEMSPYNLRMADSIAKLFPIRLRWYRVDRFDRSLLPCKKIHAQYFCITSRVAELISGVKKPQQPFDPFLHSPKANLQVRLWTYKTMKKQEWEPVDPYLQTR